MKIITNVVACWISPETGLGWGSVWLMDPVWHCYYLVREEGAGCFGFVCFFACVLSVIVYLLIFLVLLVDYQHENMSIQISCKLYHQKMKIFKLKILISFMFLFKT